MTAREDEIAQRAAVEVLNAIYETDFIGFSYGFRPGRSQHQALDALYTGLLARKVNWVLDLDIEISFDGLSHEGLVKFVEVHRCQNHILWITGLRHFHAFRTCLVNAADEVGPPILRGSIWGAFSK